MCYPSISLLSIHPPTKSNRWPRIKEPSLHLPEISSSWKGRFRACEKARERCSIRGVSNANRYAREKPWRTWLVEDRTAKNETVMAGRNGPSRCDVCPSPLAGFTQPSLRAIPRSNNRWVASRPKCSENLSLIVFGPDQRSISHQGNEFSRVWSLECPSFTLYTPLLLFSSAKKLCEPLRCPQMRFAIF